MKKKYITIAIVVIIALLGCVMWVSRYTITRIDNYNSAIDEIKTELDKVSMKYAYVNPKPVTNVELNKSQLRELYRLQVVAMEYESIAEQDTLTIEQKVDVMSVVLTNIILFYFTGESNREFNPEPSWDKWFRQIKEGTDSGITRAIE